MPSAGLHIARAALAVAALLAAALVVACGGDEEDSTERAARTDGSEPMATSEPPAETTPDDAETSSSATEEEREESRLLEESATARQGCPDVVITQNSDDGLFGVEVEGLTCEDAATALEAWGQAGYPGDAPPGFVCETVEEYQSGATRLRCEQDASGGVVEFDTGI